MVGTKLMLGAILGAKLGAKLGTELADDVGCNLSLIHISEPTRPC